MTRNDVVYLHDKATRGQPLTQREQTTLEAWYVRQDAEENALLASSALQSTTLRDLKSKIETASARMVAVTQHIQALIAENEALRGENVLLSEQLQSAVKTRRSVSRNED